MERDRIVSELQSKISDSYTPETLAWDLLVNDDIQNNNYASELIAAIDLSEEPKPDIFNKFVYEFEILATIYFEMIFGWYKLLHLYHNEETNTDTEFKPDLTNLKIEDLQNPFIDKFKIINYILHITKIENLEYYNFLRMQSYCRVVLRDSKIDETYFIANSRNLSPEKRYHFIINGYYSGRDNLEDIFLLVDLGYAKFKVNFSHLTP